MATTGFHDAMVDILQAENPNLSSEIFFDTTTADFEAWFTKSDYDAHKARFTNGNDKVVIYFKSIIVVAGSTTQGQTIADAD
jgi:hypothetical protein